MKKFMAGILAGVIIASAVVFAATAYTAHIAEFKVLVNGAEFTSDPPVLVIENRTYLPLRAIGDVLGVKVEWNEELRQVEVGEVIAPPAPKPEQDSSDEGSTITNSKNFAAMIPENMENPVVVITATYPDGSKKVVYTGTVVRAGTTTIIPIQITGNKGETITLNATFDGEEGNSGYCVIE